MNGRRTAIRTACRHGVLVVVLRVLVGVHLAVVAAAGPAVVLSAAAVLVVAAPVVRTATRRRDAAHRVLLAAGRDFGAQVGPASPAAQVGRLRR